MEPFFFGGDGTPLFGLYHPAAPPDRRHAVVFCQPLGQESMRAHRSFLLLAARLAALGFHGLRFDYLGCGDSAGDWKDWSFRRWVEDTRTAIDELRQGSGAARVSLVGLRLGAALALEAAQGCGGIDSIVLWDPVTEGGAYLKEIGAAHQAWLSGSFARAHPGREAKRIREVLGYPLNDSLVREIEHHSWSGRSGGASRVLIVETVESAANQGLSRRLSDSGVAVKHSRIPGSPVWLKGGEDFDGALVSTEVLTGISTWLAEAIR